MPSSYHSSWEYIFAAYFTRWVEGFSVATRDTLTFVNVIVNEVISPDHVPERLLSARGPNLIMKLTTSFYETLRIKNIFGEAYLP